MTVQTAIFVGMAVGFTISFIIALFTDRISGVLKIDHSNPEKDIYRFEFFKSVDLAKKKRVIVKVDNNADLSR